MTIPQLSALSLSARHCRDDVWTVSDYLLPYRRLSMQVCRSQIDFYTDAGRSHGYIQFATPGILADDQHFESLPVGTFVTLLLASCMLPHTGEARLIATATVRHYARFLATRLVPQPYGRLHRFAPRRLLINRFL